MRPKAPRQEGYVHAYVPDKGSRLLSTHPVAHRRRGGFDPQGLQRPNHSTILYVTVQASFLGSRESLGLKLQLITSRNSRADWEVAVVGTGAAMGFEMLRGLGRE